MHLIQFDLEVEQWIMDGFRELIEYIGHWAAFEDYCLEHDEARTAH